MARFSTICDNCRLTISTLKTEVTFLPVHGSLYIELQINVKRQCLTAVENITYLGSTCLRAVYIDSNVTYWITKDTSAYGRCKSMPLHQAETTYQWYVKLLNWLYLIYLHQIMHRKWQDKVIDMGVLACVSIPYIFTLLHKSTLRLAGHSSQMPDDRISEKHLYRELKCGTMPKKEVQRLIKRVFESLQNQHR